MGRVFVRRQNNFPRGTAVKSGKLIRDGAHESFERALALAKQDPERRFLQGRLRQPPQE
jgi:predicted RNA polymerase sigma factor